MRYLWNLTFLPILGLIVGIANLDILNNRPEEIGLYIAGLILEALLLGLCLSLSKSVSGRSMMICLVTGIWCASLAFFSYFDALPGRFALQYLIAEPADSLNLILSYSLLWLFVVWFAITAALSVLTEFVARKTVNPAKSIHIIYVSAAIAILISITFNGNRTSPGKGTPGLDFVYSALRSLNDSFGKPSANSLIRLQPRINIVAMQPMPRSMPINVLMIVHESLRSDRMSLYGYQEDTTPHLKRWLQVLQKETHDLFQFRNAYSNATYTHLSYPSLLSGVHPLEGVEALHTRPLLFDHIKRFNGVKTAIISSHSYESGNYAAFLRSASIDHLVYRESEGWPPWNNVGADDSYLPAALAGFLDGIGQERFFAVLHHNGNHFPYKTHDENPPEDFDSRYDQSIKYVDDITDRVFANLAQRNMLDRTLIIITSDHGESFGENGSSGHFGPIHPSNSKIPFVWLLPKNFSLESAVLSRNLNKAVSNVDIVPTILGMLEIHDKRLSGRDLHREVLEDRDDIVVYNLGTGQEILNFALVSETKFDSYSYSINSGRLMLYSLNADEESRSFFPTNWQEISCKKSQGFSPNLLRSCPIPTNSIR
jgi:glucan phosphoethanolaminetransferase (alkaline phosphatase superfamily)